MALDPIHFALDRAIGVVWDNPDLLDEASRHLVCQCLPGGRNDRPHGEGDLDVLQLALSACEFLSRIGDARIHWLSNEGQAFPKAVRAFIYQTALQFHQCEKSLPEQFVNTLANFVHSTNSHVATLNYDNLLYQPLIERQVLCGYNGALVDGFFRDGFAVENLKRKYRRTFGYYLHLHGSPLFVNRGQMILKLAQSELVENADTVSSHIVLTHVEHKPTVISASNLLIAYWRQLLDALGESEEIILFGYSGADEHLNSILQGAPRETPVRIVEWNGKGDREERMRYWGETLPREVTLLQCPNILEFKDW